MYLHELINPNGNEVVVHKQTGVIKLLSATGAVFDRPPMVIGDTSTISRASELLMHGCWERADVVQARAQHAKWTQERTAWKTAMWAEHYGSSAVVTGRVLARETNLASAPRNESPPRLRLVHDADALENSE